MDSDESALNDARKAFVKYRPDAVAVASGTMGTPRSTAVAGDWRPRITALSPHYSTANVAWPLDNVDDKVLICCDRLRGWQLNIAEECLSRIPHGAFAALAIAFSYFETVAQLKRGEESAGNARSFFIDGVKIVFGGLDESKEEDIALFEALWKGFRNGLYHQSMTRPLMSISADWPWMFLLVTGTGPVLMITDNGHVLRGAAVPADIRTAIRGNGAMKGSRVYLNPYHLIPALQRHLAEFERDLLNPTNTDPRERFDRAFDALHGDR